MGTVKYVLIPLAVGALLLLTKVVAPQYASYVPAEIVSWVVFFALSWGAIGTGRTQNTVWCGLLAACAVMSNPLAPLAWPEDWEKWANLTAGVLSACCVVRLWK